MTQPIELSDRLLDDASRHASVSSRSVPEQIEYWSRIGKIAEENPDLPYQFIKGVLLGRQEVADGDVTEYRFG